jgi:hypothetical protein
MIATNPLPAIGNGHAGAPVRTPSFLPSDEDPTYWPPPGYTRERANLIYGEAFRRFFEYLSGTNVPGDVLEFGTMRGFTARIMATLIRDFRIPRKLYLFDSFEGFPAIGSVVDQSSYEVAVNKVWAKGGLDVGGLDMSVRVRQALAPLLPADGLQVIKGYFEDTLEANLPNHTKAALIHVDCDLYGSARYVLERIMARDLLQDGCLLVFDDFNCNRANPQMGERRALAETFANQDRFEYSPWFSYGWHGQAFFVHDRRAIETIQPLRSA